MFNELVFDENYLEPEVEEYINFLDEDEQNVTGFLTKKRVMEHFEECGEMLNQFVVYPDRFIDLITPKANHFKLFYICDFLAWYIKIVLSGFRPLLTLYVYSAS